MKTGDEYKGGIWCEPCGHAHGPCYVCPHYPPNVQADRLACEAKLREQLANPDDPVWQGERGETARTIMGWFMGPDRRGKS